MPLHRLMPYTAVVFVLAGLASMGMPGFSGFPAELTILIGTWQVSKLWSVLAAGGVLIAAAFTLRVMQVVFFGQTDAASDTTTHPHLMAPITWPERAGTLLLLGATILVGLKPDILLNWIIPSLPVLIGGAP
jgi:NADH-quinone oxidoreductase subunit M